MSEMEVTFSRSKSLQLSTVVNLIRIECEDAGCPDCNTNEKHKGFKARKHVEVVLVQFLTNILSLCHIRAILCSRK